jgi:hypothetical protein
LQKSVRRVLSAASISAAIYGGTWLWYQGTQTSGEDNSNVKPVAFADHVESDVRRRPASRLIWQALNTGEPLFPGEAIRTGGRGQIRIRFPDNKRYLDLDPDSLIVINSTDKDIALDLMDGSVLVAGDKGEAAGGGANSGGALTLNSEKGKIDLSRSTASLSKSAKGLDVTVLKGKVTGTQGEDISQQLAEAITVLSPAADTPLLLNADSIDPVRFSWQAFPTASKFQLWLGESPKDLKSIAEVEKLNFLDKKVPSGKRFYKIVGLDKGGQVLGESHVRRLDIITKRPPGPIAPTDDSYFHVGREENTINFKWTTITGTPVEFELSDQSDFKNKIEAKAILNEGGHSKVLKSGEYYWRLSVKYEGFEKPLYSKTLHFTVSSKPKVLAQIRWQPGLEVQKYFTTTSLNLAWTTQPKDIAKHWKLRVWPAELGRIPASVTDGITVDMKKQQATQPVQGPGKYFASIEAYNENEGLIASSEVQPVILSPQPLLPAPEFEPKEGQLQAMQSGGMALKWTKLEDVKEYKLKLLDKAGKELKTASFTKNSTNLINLMPGEYKVEVYAVDIHGRESEKGPTRVLVVPDTSGLKAPKIKKVEIN